MNWSKNYPESQSNSGDDVNFYLFALPRLSGDRDCGGFRPAAETCGCGGE